MRINLPAKIQRARNNLKVTRHGSIQYEAAYYKLLDLFMEKVKRTNSLELLIKLDEWYRGWVDYSILNTHEKTIWNKYNVLYSDISNQLSEATCSEQAFNLFRDLAAGRAYFEPPVRLVGAVENYKEVAKRINEQEGID